jgi:hypothetical protein
MMVGRDLNPKSYFLSRAHSLLNAILTQDPLPGVVGRSVLEIFLHFLLSLIK